MHLRRALLVLLAVALISCAPAPIAASDLEAILIADGDLPAGISAGQIRAALVAGAPGDAAPIVARDIAGGGAGDEVAILVYADAEAAAAAAPAVLPGAWADGVPLPDVGDQARQRANVVVAVRCRAVILVRLTGPPPAAVATLARRIDRRAQVVVC